MGPQRACANQGAISPGQGLLQSATIPCSTKLSSSPSSRGETAVQADGEHQPKRRCFGELQEANTASRAVGLAFS